MVAAAVVHDAVMKGQAVGPSTAAIAQLGAKGKYTNNCERDMIRYCRRMGQAPIEE